MRLRLLVCLVLVAGGSVPRAQDVATLPPIPQIEQFIPRGQLKVSLRLSADRLVPGDVPVFWLVLENAGNTTIRVPRYAELGHNVARRVSTASGDGVRSLLDCITERWIGPTAVRNLVVLVPRQSTTFRLEDTCGDGQLPPLPVGEYHIRATYRNYADWPFRYDIYEDDGAQAWDGEIETPPVTFIVEPFDADTERALIDAVEREADATAAIRLVGLSRTRGAVDPLLRRFARDAAPREEIIAALGYIGGSSTAERLATAIERLPPRDRQLLRTFSFRIDRYVPMLVRDSRDCDGMGLLLTLPSLAAAQVIERQCTDLRTRLRDLRDAPLPPARESVEGQRIAHRADAARGLLAAFERPPADPVMSRPRDIKAQPGAARLSESVATIRSAGNGDDAQELAVSGVTRFGTAETFGQLRAAMESDDEDGRYRVGRALAAFSFQGDDPTSAMTTPSFWDRWWQQNRRRSRSREQWAREALARRDPLSESLAWTPASGKWRAAEYLITAQRGRAQLVRELATHRSWRVRLGAADALVPFDRQYAGRLMLRELHNRYVGACTAAGTELSRLTGRSHSSQCLDVAERERVTVLWTQDVNLLPRGPLRAGQ